MSQNENIYNSWVEKHFTLNKTGKVYTTKFTLFNNNRSPSPYGIKMDDNENISNPIPMKVQISNRNGEFVENYTERYFNNINYTTLQDSIANSGDPYDNEPLFEHYDCRWVLDKDGKILITDLSYPGEIDGNEGLDFDRSSFEFFQVDNGQGGTLRRVKNVGVVYPTWYVKTWKDINYWYVSITDSPLDGYLPMCASVAPDGTIQAFQVRSKYILGTDGNYETVMDYPVSLSKHRPIGGHKPSDEPGTPPSYRYLINYCHKLGNEYCATTTDDWFFIQLLFMIKYATVNSQANSSTCVAISGTTSYDYSSQILSNELIATNSFKVSLTEGAKYIVGSTISANYGTGGNRESDSKIFWSRQIKSIQTIIYNDEQVSKITVSGDPFIIDINDRTLNPLGGSAYIVSMPYYSGLLDGIHSDGAIDKHVTDGKGPGIIGGIEFGVGGYEVLGNVVVDIQEDSSGLVYRNIYINHNARNLTYSITTIKQSSDYSLCSYIIPGNEGAWKYILQEGIDIENGIMVPITIGGATSVTGFCDGCYNDKAVTGQREFMIFGSLLTKTQAGAWLQYSPNPLTGSHWSILSRVSPNGMYGDRKNLI